MEPTEPQKEFIKSGEGSVIFAGTRVSGKTEAIARKVVREVELGNSCRVYGGNSPATQNVERRVEEYAAEQNKPLRRTNDRTFVISGVPVKFQSADGDCIRGNVDEDVVFVDEAQTLKDETLHTLINHRFLGEYRLCMAGSHQLGDFLGLVDQVITSPTIRTGSNSRAIQSAKGAAASFVSINEHDILIPEDRHKTEAACMRCGFKKRLDNLPNIDPEYNEIYKMYVMGMFTAVSCRKS